MYVLLEERVRALALADRSTGRAIDEDGHLADPDTYAQAWAEWLEHDPANTKEAREQRRIREIMGEAA